MKILLCHLYETARSPGETLLRIHRSTPSPFPESRESRRRAPRALESHAPCFLGLGFAFSAAYFGILSTVAAGRSAHDKAEQHGGHCQRSPQESAPMNYSDPRIPRRLRRKDYTVGWICALPVELAAARMMLDDGHKERTKVSVLFLQDRIGTNSSPHA